ncbi:tetratricopeptide repeat protein [Halospina denitrificans]|uniref:Tetratricopeptide repeat protein n=2 Tax=Halospina denitrificans TaxID=332522 RepID=A0A4R7JNY2_9GAMM|nr:tetratricopeptide repeat protein [Halospina denitrificans]
MLGLLASASVVASEADRLSPQERFRAGVEAFQAGELKRSRALLEAAWEGGVDTTALHYNLGVVYYKLGEYQRAEAHFGRLLDTSQRDLALYNLGLVARADSRESKARAYFRQVAEEAERDALRRLAHSRLDTREEKKAPEKPAPPLQGVVSLSAGHEDNISRLPDTGPSQLSDSFSDALLALRGELSALEVSAAAYRRHYHSESDYSADFGRLGLAWVNQSGERQTRIGLKQAYLRFGGESRQWQSTLEMDYRLNNCLTTASDRCTLNLEGTHITPYTGFSSREGERYRATASYKQRRNNWEGSLRYRAELNERKDLETDRIFISHSPRRHGLFSELAYQGFSQLSLGGEIGYRYSNYPDDFRLGSTASGHRWDHRYELGFTADWALGAAVRLKGEAIYTRNDSSLERFDYGSRRFQLSLRYRL